ncbi:MAG TPA: hypothetical protein DF699_03585 [Phycisphaerales bacterium]|nr:hypothetical protein [Phycisphaerales bacterium]
MMIRLTTTAAALAVVAPLANAGTVYNDSASLLADIGSNYFVNDFSTVTANSTADINAAYNSFSYTVAAESTNLFNGAGFVSITDANDAIEVTFTGSAVNVIGGNFWATDVNFNPVATDITILLSDGTSTTFTTSGPTDFRGFTSSVAISTILISTADGASFASLDNFYVGVVPLPTAAWAGLGLLGVMGGVRATRRRA